MKQKGGKDSTNYQAETITFEGVSASEVRDIALDIFKANFLDLSQQASELASTRAEILVNDFLNKLEKQNPKGIEQLKKPDMQYALFEAQKEYARTGDVNLEKMLIEVLVERTKETNPKLKEIILDESLKVLPKLTQQQMDILSIAFLLKRVSFNITDHERCLEELLSIYNELLKPFTPLELINNNITFNHLEYTGVATISLAQVSFEELLFDRLPNNFTKINKEEFNSIINRNNPILKNIKDIWNNTELKRLEITSVGIAIGHANLKRKADFNSNLDIWLS